MAIKSLTITEEAYDALKILKHDDESFSEVILRLSKEKIGKASRFFGTLKINESAVKELESNIKKRRSEIEKEFSKRSIKIREALS